MTNLIVEISKYLMILLMAVYTYANFRFFSFPDMERKRRVCQTEPGHVRHTFSGIPGHVPEDRGRGMQNDAHGILRGAGGIFPVLHLSVPDDLPECVQAAGKQRLYAVCVGFIMLTRLSMAKGLDKALRQFAIVVISAALAWLVPYIMERVWQLYKLPVGICGGRAPDSSCGMGFRKRELSAPSCPLP